MDFARFVQAATGFTPYPYQQRLADEGLPGLLRVPTGSGKTVAAVLPWLYRRRFHPDQAVRDATPHWLVIALPLRTLVDQVDGEVATWLAALGLSHDVGLHVLMGGRPKNTNDWTNAPERDAIIVGSIDMLLSRAMNRGYASNRFRWPIDFGMFNSGVQWVFDEVQLLGPSLPTSRQLQAFRDKLGTVLPTRSMWMSATVLPDWLRTVDAPDVGPVVEITDEDRRGALGTRTAAARVFRELANVDSRKPATVAEAVLRLHRAGTRTICFVNTVAAARKLHSAISKKTDIDVVLVHSRFRPPDRARAAQIALNPDLGDKGRIIVTTQALEAGVDVTSSTLFTEAAPWTSIVQRAGRCNRYGETADAQVWWYAPAKPHPYEPAGVEKAETTLRAVEGQSLSSEQLAGLVDEKQPDHPVLRRRDLIEVFDTTPTLTGEDTDISMYIRDDMERDVFVGWRDVPDSGPTAETHLFRDELCRVPLTDAKSWVKKLADRKGIGLWRFDPEDGDWKRARAADLHPGIVLIADLTAGGYSDDGGWDPRSKATVSPITVPVNDRDASDSASDDSVGADSLTHIDVWVKLADHLADTEESARTLLDALGGELTPSLRRAVIAAAALHDIGKAHTTFQETMLRSAGDNEHPDPGEIWAKSSQAKRSQHSRPHFRHELVSALMLGSEGARHVLPTEAGLTRYLVAAHHGRVRLALRSLERDADLDDEGRTVVLGVIDGETVPALTLGDGRVVPSATMNVAGASLMGGEYSWTRLTLPLRDRADLGPFRLAWMEAVVRLADWQASAHPTRTVAVAASKKVTK